jgi:hypothetical protein
MRPYVPGQSLYNLIKSAIPEFTETEYPLFIEFITAFLRFLEQKRTFTPTDIFPQFGAPGTIQTTVTAGGPAYEARKLLEYRDAKTTLDEFTKNFLDMFGQGFPTHTFVDANTLLKGLREFYQSKGTSESIKWFFRVIFNEDANVYFPRTDILQASAGDWDAPVTLKVSTPLDGHPNGDVYTFYAGQRVITTTGTALVENVITTVVGQNFNQNVIVNELFLRADSIQGTFEPNQILHNIDSDVQVQTKILPVVEDLIVETGGSNYSPGDIIVFSEGPSGGAGYGAFGSVKTISNSSIDTVSILDGGDGYLTGLPITFTSTTGTGASAVISEIIYGDVELEDGTGFVLMEDQSPTVTNNLILEDKNVLDLELLIGPFVNASATVTLDSPDYGIATGVSQMDGTQIDSVVDIALVATDSKPFMHPWVFTNDIHTTATLANAATLLTLNSNTFFGNSNVVFVLSGIADVTTNSSTANVTASVIVSDVTVGNGQNMIYLTTITHLEELATSTYLKQDGNGVSQSGNLTTTIGSANIVGSGTSFTTTIQPNSHVCLPDGSHVVIRTVANNTLMTATAPLTVAVNGAFSIVPVGRIDVIIPQAQRFYGKIKTIQLLSNGQRYLTPPAVSAESVSAEAQGLFYLDNAFTNSAIIVPAETGQIDVFTDARLQAQQNAGQILRVNIINSGVNYTDPDHMRITAVHHGSVMGEEATFEPVLGAVTHYPGSFRTSAGFLSDNKFLQDSTYYNNFTYVVSVAESFQIYKDLFLKLIHPAGFKLLGTFLLTLEATVDFNSTDLIPVFEPISRNALISNDILYVLNDNDFRMAIDMGEAVIGRRSRTVTYSLPASGVPDVSLFEAANTFSTSTDYELALGTLPIIQWAVDANATQANSTGSLAAVGTYSSVANSDIGPTYPHGSVSLTANTSKVQYVYSDANTELFVSRSAGPQHDAGTLIIWYQPTSFPAANAMIFGDNNWLSLRINSSGYVFGVLGSKVISASRPLVLNTWHYLALGFKGLQMDAFYLHQNGVLQNVAPLYTGTFTPRTLTIGSSNTGIINTAPGLYAQAGVYNTGLSFDYVTQLYAARFRDGAESMTVIATGSGNSMIYPWSTTAISGLSANTISQNYYANTTFNDTYELLVPGSGLN